MLRAFLERASRDRVLRRRMPAAFGGHALFVSPDASLRFWRRDLSAADPTLLGLAAELVRPGNVVWDIGANVGLFAFAAAFLAGPGGRVLAVEADDWLTGLLRRTRQGVPAGYAAVDVLTAAAAEKAGVVEFCIAQRGRAGSHLRGVEASTQTGGVRSVAHVVAVTLDGLLETFPPPQLVKIDVEGAEHLCLRGAERLLGEVRPVLICEVSLRNVPEIGRILRRHRYAMADASRMPSEREPLAEAVWNTLALPVSDSA